MELHKQRLLSILTQEKTENPTDANKKQVCAWGGRACEKAQKSTKRSCRQRKPGSDWKKD
jgi:hypothetical protein